MFANFGMSYRNVKKREPMVDYDIQSKHPRSSSYSSHSSDTCSILPSFPVNQKSCSCSHDTDTDGEDIDPFEERSEDEEASESDEAFIDDAEEEDAESDDDREFVIVDDESDHSKILEEKEEQAGITTTAARRAFRPKSAGADMSLQNMIAHLVASLLLEKNIRLDINTMSEGSAMNRARKELDGSWHGELSNNDTVISFRRFLGLRKQIIQMVKGLEEQNEMFANALEKSISYRKIAQSIVLIDSQNEESEEFPLSPLLNNVIMIYHMCTYLKGITQENIILFSPDADPEECLQDYRQNFEVKINERLSTLKDQILLFLKSEKILHSQNFDE